ncbi:MAG: DUF2336 domain-containing protein [Alphaproteobacteria bacterium]
MDIHFIEGDTRSAALLPAQLSDIQNLCELARDKDPSARAELARSVGYILEAEVSPRESEIIADILIGLLRQAEADVRYALSEQLSKIEDAPLRLILQLANDDIDIARPILVNSDVLGDMDLMYIIKSKTNEYWQTIATRDHLSDSVIDVLADTEDFDTALALAENEGIKLTDHALIILSDIAQGSDILAKPLLLREEVSQDIAVKLYKFVGEEIKSFIGENYNFDIQKVSKAVDDTVADLSDTSFQSGLEPEPYMIDAAETFKEQGLLNVQMLLNTLRRGHMRSYIAQFSVYTGLSVKAVQEILSQSNGQGLAITSRAYGIEKHDFVSMFMLSSRIWNNGRLVETDDIKAAIGYYTKATPEIAMHIVKTKFSGS